MRLILSLLLCVRRRHIRSRRPSQPVVSAVWVGVLPVALTVRWLLPSPCAACCRHRVLPGCRHRLLSFTLTVCCLPPSLCPQPYTDKFGKQKWDKPFDNVFGKPVRSAAAQLCCGVVVAAQLCGGVRLVPQAGPAI